MKNSNLSENISPRKWRTQATHDRYLAERQADKQKADFCPLCESPTIEKFQYWRTVKNKYPYDAVADKHDMVIPIRHTTEKDLHQEELAELTLLKETTLNNQYDLIIEALPNTKSIPGHHHLHLLQTKTIG